MYSISTNIENKSIHVIVEQNDNGADIKNDDLEFAFYLYVGGVRETISWYQRNNYRTFTNIFNSDYSIKVHAFVRIKSSGEVVFNQLHMARAGIREPYSVGSYPLRYTSNSSEILIDTIDLYGAQTLHTVQLSDKHSIDILTNAPSDNGIRDKILFCFSGAVPSRMNKTAPFFSGVSTSKRHNIALCAFDDPLVARNSTLGLGWYFGKILDINLHSEIAKIIDMICAKYSSTPILLGASGGGFAVLSILQHMKTKSRAIVINPQTNIARYNKKAVKNLMKHSMNISVDEATLDHERAANIFDEYNVSFRITSSMLSNHDVLYLQNKSDSVHIKDHLEPFLGRDEKINIDLCDYIKVNKNVSVWLGNWGEGHAPITSSLLDATLTQIFNNVQITNIKFEQPS
ncbi:hypothetical protein JD543_10480 [Aeromonas caviae]|uniref:hypothetical protein n=1 Tax=Aeromonas caviae TaxID=648 RepID=UPI00191EB75D|nr:hypothetical protein [Aeromonas caviae]MBL0437871.1 hypothetical protein [Aeromonas caviae]